MIRPILFNTEMVRAIQEGRKTVTRRLMSAEAAFACANHEELQMHVPFQAGDVLWVRESWFFSGGLYLYRADFEGIHDDLAHWNWRPSIHMPRDAARIFLKVTKVSCQNLQDITDTDARAEGLGDPDVIYTNGALSCMFADIWDSTMPKSRLDKQGWAADPWVWVIRFRVCEKPEGWPG